MVYRGKISAAISFATGDVGLGKVETARRYSGRENCSLSTTGLNEGPSDPATWETTGQVRFWGLYCTVSCQFSRTNIGSSRTNNYQRVVT